MGTALERKGFEQLARRTIIRSSMTAEQPDVSGSLSGREIATMLQSRRLSRFMLCGLIWASSIKTRRAAIKPSPESSPEIVGMSYSVDPPHAVDRPSDLAPIGSGNRLLLRLLENSYSLISRVLPRLLTMILIERHFD